VFKGKERKLGRGALLWVWGLHRLFSGEGKEAHGRPRARRVTELLSSANLDRTGAWYGGSQVQESSLIFVRDIFGCGWQGHRFL
jgi:hypothetical protein